MHSWTLLCRILYKVEISRCISRSLDGHKPVMRHKMRTILNTNAGHALQSEEAKVMENESRYMSPILSMTWWASPFSQRPLVVSALVRSHLASSIDVPLPYIAVHFALSVSS